MPSNRIQLWGCVGHAANRRESARSESARSESARSDPSRLDPSRLDPSRLDPSRVGSIRVGSIRVGSIRVGSIRVGSIRAIFRRRGGVDALPSFRSTRPAPWPSPAAMQDQLSRPSPSCLRAVAPRIASVARGESGAAGLLRSHPSRPVRPRQAMGQSPPAAAAPGMANEQGGAVGGGVFGPQLQVPPRAPLMRAVSVRSLMAREARMTRETRIAGDPAHVKLSTRGPGPRDSDAVATSELQLPHVADLGSQGPS
jgi:hypothetical protein